MLRWPLGAALLALVLAWLLGGQMLLGRIDPALVIPWLFAALLPLAWFGRGDAPRDRIRANLIALAALLVGQGLLSLALADSLPWAQVAVTALSGLAAAALADWIVQRAARSLVAKALIAKLAAILWFAAGHAALAALYEQPASDTPVTMLSGLPLRWAGEGDLAAMLQRGAADDPALVRLERTHRIALVDSLADHVPPAGAALLLAHPRALAPQDLVAIDAFVRGGGRALILADALSGWPAPHPTGDSRNPPVTSLLTPLLGHWGITLGAAPAGETAAQAIDVDGRRLRLFSAGRFEALPSGCTAQAGAQILRCRVGAGEAWLVGDADLLFAPLWQPLVGDLPHLRRADTIEWIGARLDGPDYRAPLLQPVWIAHKPR
ncbi:hypothetical protein BWQ93_00475 [Sphingopyxis sp. QXT-31]|uniref:Gldg family protein n=1 Tax=Sphingopyxis sp. QXT-31 TaxID=1357916 RepID=UPI00097943A8|nr:hypothetical protein [Sphingopyxis sp. QXT-31]APZ97137.1 hypothetical protein BWQ93_00475 [Sphingopyxis sp. QXT-31]